MHIRSWVRDHLLSVRGNTDTYLEPFVGGGGIAEVMVPHFQNNILSDAHEDLILMWQSLRDGWIPPTTITKEQYDELRDAEPSALRGFVGFGASWGGKWFGGYVDQPWDKFYGRVTQPYMETAARAVLRTSAVFQAHHTTIAHKSYEFWSPRPNNLVYCDIPYKGTTGYKGVGAFDQGAFWDWATQWSLTGATIVVSESEAPDNWEVLAERKRKNYTKVSTDKGNRREALFMLRR